MDESKVRSCVAGALFDFTAFLTSRKPRLVLGSEHDVTPAIGALREFAKLRNLSLDEAEVMRWAHELGLVELPVGADGG